MIFKSPENLNKIKLCKIAEIDVLNLDEEDYNYRNEIIITNEIIIVIMKNMNIIIIIE